MGSSLFQNAGEILQIFKKKQLINEDNNKQRGLIKLRQILVSMMSPCNCLVTVVFALLKDFFSVYGGRISYLANMIFFASRTMPKLYLVTEALTLSNMFHVSR